MKILAFTDSHASGAAMKKIKEKSTRADIVICCGDFTVFDDGLKQAIEDMDSLGKPVLLIHGNHESPEMVEKACKKTKHVKYIHEKFFEYKDIVFCGYGGGGFNQRDLKFELFSDEIIEYMQKKPGKQLVVAFHMPPYKTKLDLLPMGHVGSVSYTEFIKKQKPILTLSGHIEENNGKKDTIGKTIVLNPGPNGMIIEIQKQYKA